MTSRRSMTRDIHESIRLLLGKNVKILLKSPVKLELKGGDKTENRILVFTAHRLFIMTAKVPTRIDHHFHYLDFKHVESKRRNQISFSFHGDAKTYTFRPANEAATVQNSDTVDEMILVLISAVKRVFPGVPVENVIGRVDLVPPDRGSLRDHITWKPPDPKLVGPCGGFSAQYSCMCDYFSLPFREEVAWDVDTIYFSHDSHEMCLQDFEHLDHRDLLCIISALEHNTWFTKLKASANSAKLTADLCDRILQVVAKSISLTELHVPSIGARWDFAAKFAQALNNNPVSALTSFDMSCNFLEDKGINNLSTVLSKMPRGLHHVNLSYCSLTPKGLVNFSNALLSNRLNTSTLTYLNLAGNVMKEESHALCSFLTQPNTVAILDISSTETPLDVLFSALVRGCTTSLTHLNLSRNPFSSKKAKEIPGAFKQFFASTLVLQYLNMSHCKMPPEAVKHLLLGLACNEATANVELTLNNNNFGANGANVFESCIGGVKCISRLDLSENGIDAEMAGVMQGIARNKHIMSLNVSKNMTGIKSKYIGNVIESIVMVVQDEETSLTKLNLSDCKLKGEINNIINALGSNQCLQHLDITGNMMGDIGARLLAKALQINTRLKIINLDRNGISLQGYTDITYSLQSNYAMKHIPFPTYDLQPFIKTHPDRVDAIIHRMQELLQRNSNPHRFRNTAQAFRLTQGFLMSSTQQILDRVSAQTQDNLEAMKKLNPEATNEEDMGHAQKLIQDAENSKHLPSALHEVTARGTEVDVKLKQVSLDLSNFVMSHVQQNLDAMITCADRQCPTAMSQKEGKTKSELREVCQKKCQISPDFISSLIMNQLGMEVHNKVNELNLVIASHITEKVIDDIIDSLSGISKSLVSEVGSLRKKRSLTPDVLKGRSSSVSDSNEQETISLSGTTGTGASGDATSQKSESSPIGTPQTNKRKSLHGRKLRPKSVADGAQEKDTSSSSPPSGNTTRSADDSAPDLLASSKPRANGTIEEDTVPELPSTTVLQHLGKARPKRAKRHAPSRGAIVQHNTSTDGEDDGLSKFYTSSANASLSPGSTPSGSPLLEESPHPRGGSISSISREVFSKSVSKNSSKEDLAGGGTPPSGGAISSLFARKMSSEDSRKMASPDVDRRSPVPPPKPSLNSSGEKSKLSSGFSCLTSTTTDSDDDSAGRINLAKPSPEKRALSPSLHSISDIFGSKSPSAVSKSQKESKESSSSTPVSSSSSKVAAALSPGISPFASRKTDSELLSTRRKSFNPGEDDKAQAPSSSSEATDSGKKTPDEVVKRHGIGHGRNPDLMAEIKEKRASMVPKAATDTDLLASPSRAMSTSTTAGLFGGGQSSENLMERVKLRSTGLAGNLKSPTNEFATSATATSSGTATSSLASSGAACKNLSSGIDDKSCNKLETKDSSTVKPGSGGAGGGGGGSIVGLRASKFSSSLTGNSSSSPEASNKLGVSPSDSGAGVTPTTAKPKPLPKPRPWSIVGVDRKSGEMTTVGGATSGESSTEGPNLEGKSANPGLVPAATASNAAASRKSSVRDLINNMNKVGEKSAESTPTEGFVRRKGNSLPRGVAAPGEGANDASAAAKASPNAGRKESTSDDPRILKLDDDFSFDEVLDV